MCGIAYCDLCGWHWRQELCQKYEFYRGGCKIHLQFLKDGTTTITFPTQRHPLCVSKYQQGSSLQELRNEMITGPNLSTQGESSGFVPVHLQPRPETPRPSDAFPSATPNQR